MKILISTVILLSMISMLTAQSIGELEKLGGEKMANGHYSEALAYYQQAITLITDETSHATTFAYAGMCAKELGDVSTAKTLFIKSVERGIEEPQVFDALGNISRQEKDYDTQIMAYKAGVQRLPSDQQKYQLKLCSVYRKQKDGQQLLDMADTILASDGTHPKALQYKGTALQYLKKMGEAESVFKTLYDLDNENINANIFLGNYNYQVGKNKLAASRKKYDKIPQPTRVQWHEENERNKGTMESYYRPAIKHLEYVYTMKPSSSIKKMLFTMYTKMGENEKAVPYKAD